MEINITWNLCRVCLQEEKKNNNNHPSNGQMKPLFCDDGNKVAQHIYECSGITMKPNDGLPEKICQKCLAILKYAINFRKTCRDSDTYLQSILQRTKSASILFKPESFMDLVDEMGDPFSCDDQEDKETKSINEEDTEFELENPESLKRARNNCLIKQSKKLRVDDSTSSRIVVTKQQDTQVETNTIDEHVIAPDVDEHGDTFDHDNKVEKDEEIVENPEQIMEQIFSNTAEEDAEEAEEIEDHAVSNLKRRPSHLQEFFANSNYTTLPNNQLINKSIVEASEGEDHDDVMAEAQESDIHLKHENEEFLYLHKNIKNQNHTTNNIANDDSHQDIEHIDETNNHDHQDTDNNLDIIPIGEEDEVEEELDVEDVEEVEDAGVLEEAEDVEELILHLENDNQSQVTSTVVSKEDYDFNEENSNLSNVTNDLTAEYIIDEYFIEDNQSNNSSENSNSIPNAKQKNYFAKFSTHKNHSPVILHGRINKHDHTTASATSSTGAQQQVLVCDLCGNQFTSRQLMNAHMKVHRQEKNHECEICFKRFITACNLQAHMRIHTGEKPFECQYCYRRFSDRSSNLRHERTHTKEKPFQCDDCGKKFSLATTLLAHSKVHTGVRSYRCEPCAKSFKLPHQLKAHQNTSLHKAVEHLVKVEK